MDNRQLLRARIAAAGNPKPVPAVIANLGEVFLKVNTLATSEAARAKLTKDRPDDLYVAARALSLILCDEDGILLYDMDDPSDMDELAALHPDVASEVFAKSKAANRLTKEEAQGKAETQSGS